MIGVGTYVAHRAVDPEGEQFLIEVHPDGLVDCATRPSPDRSIRWSARTVLREAPTTKVHLKPILDRALAVLDELEEIVRTLTDAPDEWPMGGRPLAPSTAAPATPPRRGDLSGGRS